MPAPRAPRYPRNLPPPVLVEIHRGKIVESRHRGHVIVAVSHAEPIKAAVAWALDTDDRVAWRTFVGLASITRIGITERGPLLRTFNEMAHLGQDQ